MVSERTAISKRLRFEVFKRDRFMCAYCGAHPPGAVLQVDHIHPVAQGGGNDQDNLITACQACNIGKSDRLLSEVPKSLAEKAAATAEIEEQIAGYEAVMRERRERIEDDAQTVLNTLCDAFGLDSLSRADFASIKRFIEHLGLNEVLWAAETSVARYRFSYRRAFLYFCGICWRKIKEPGDEN